MKSPNLATISRHNFFDSTEKLVKIHSNQHHEAIISQSHITDRRAMKQQLLFALKFLTLSGVYMFTRSTTPANKLRNPEKSLLVLFVLENLKRIFIDNKRLIKESRTEVELLDNDIRLFKAFLKDCADRRSRNAAVEELAAEIESVVAEAEIVIAAYATEAAEIRRRNCLQRAVGGQTRLVAAAKKVRVLRVKVKKIYGRSREAFFR